MESGLLHDGLSTTPQFRIHKPNNPARASLTMMTCIIPYSLYWNLLVGSSVSSSSSLSSRNGLSAPDSPPVRLPTRALVCPIATTSPPIALRSVESASSSSRSRSSENEYARADDRSMGAGRVKTFLPLLEVQMRAQFMLSKGGKEKRRTFA